MLDGSGSYHTDGEITEYFWEQVSGPSVLLSDEESVMPTFTAPNETTTLSFDLSVNDSEGLQSSDTVVINVIVSVFEGCTDETAQNYDENATVDCSDCCAYAPESFALLTPTNNIEISFDELSYPNLFISFSWEESFDQNDGDQILYNLIIKDISNDAIVLDLEEYAQESLDVPISFLIENPEIDEPILFEWEVIAKDNSEGTYSTTCDNIFNYTLIYEGINSNGDGLIPDNYALNNAYPNPFNPITNIDYALPESGYINLSIYDINGKLIETLEKGNKVAGYYSILWNASNIPSGNYFIRFTSSKYNATKRVSLVK